MTSTEVEKTRKAYTDALDNLSRHYGVAGRTVLDQEAWGFLLALSAAYYRVKRTAGEDQESHPWLPAGTPLRMGWMMHELGRTHDYIQHQKRIVEELRRAHLIAKVKAGEFVSPHSLESAGINPEEHA